MATAESAAKILCTGTCQTESASACRTVPDDADDTCHKTTFMPDSQFHSSKSISFEQIKWSCGKKDT